MTNKTIFTITPYYSIIKGVLAIMLFSVAFIIFDKPMFNFFICENVSLLDAFTINNYIKKEWLISVFWSLSFTYCLINKIQPNNWTWKINTSRILYDIAMIILGGYYLSIRTEITTFSDSTVQLSSFSFAASIRYLDVILIIPLLSIINIAGIVIHKISDSEVSDGTIWVSDLPILTINDDAFDRSELALNISKQINSISEKDSSFSIGIVGPWGSGKSSFLGFIKEEIKKNKTNEIMDFNPWQYPNETILSYSFLQEIEIRFERHSFRIARHINDYMHKLFKNNGSFTGLIINTFLRARSISEIYIDIKEAILKSNKRLVVFIDDLDRLQPNEVHEILTIIRNIGNLPNTVFVLAYDKEYVLEQLKSTKVNQPSEFLSKFFQVEFSLGKIPADRLYSDLAERLEAAFKDDVFKSAKTSTTTQEEDLINAASFVNSLSSISLIKTKRDIIKIMNNLMLTWPQLKDYTIFKDYFLLELLRMKYNNIYTLLKNDRLKLLRNHPHGYVFDSVLLNKVLENDKLTIHDHHALNNLLSTLFPQNPYVVTENKVCNPLTYENYFRNEVYNSNLVATMTSTLKDGKI